MDPPQLGGQFERLAGPLAAIAGGLVMARGGVTAYARGLGVDTPREPRRGRARTVRGSVAQLAALAGAAALVVLDTYSPVLSRLGETVDQMRAVQGKHSEIGHAVLVDGQLYLHPPWWAHFTWMHDGIGTLGVTLLGALAVAALLFLRGDVLAYLAAATVIPMAYLARFPGFGLPHYWFVWAVPLTLLCGLALAQLLAARLPLRVAGIAAVAGLALAGFGQLREVYRMDAGDYQLAAAALERAGVPPRSVVVWGYPEVLGAYMDGSGGARRSGAGTAIVVDPLISNRVANPAVRYLLAANPQQFKPPLAIDRLTVYLPASGG